MVNKDSESYSEALSSQDAPFWHEAIEEEMQSIISNNTWILVDLPYATKSTSCKWNFENKKANGTLQEYRASWLKDPDKKRILFY